MQQVTHPLSHGHTQTNKGRVEIMRQKRLVDFLFLFTLFSLFLIIPVNADWSQIKYISINNTQNPNELMDFQFLINVTKESEMLSGFDDLAFFWYNETNDSETQIPFCLGRDCPEWMNNDGSLTSLSTANDSFTDVVLNVKYIPASNYSKVFMKYQNDTPMNSLSDSEATWWVNDEFNDVYLNTSKWNTSLSFKSANGNYSFEESGGILNMTTWDDSTSYSGADLLTYESYVPKEDPAVIWISMKHYFNSPNYGAMSYFYEREEIQSHSSWFARDNTHNGNDAEIMYKNNNTAFSTSTPSIIDPTSGYYVYGLVTDGNFFAFYQDENFEDNATSNIPSDLDDYFSKYRATSSLSGYGGVFRTNSILIDYVRGRRYSAVEPTYLFEEAPYISITFNYSSVIFGSMTQGSANNPAQNQASGVYNVTIDTNINYEVLANATDFSDGTYTIAIANMNMGLNETSAGNLVVGDSVQLSTSPVTIETSLSLTDTVNYHGFWLDVPNNQYASSYQSNMTVTYQSV